MRRFVILRLARSPTSDTAWVDRVLDSVGGEAVGVVICVFSSYQEHRGDTDCFAATIIYSTGVLFTTAGWYYRRTTGSASVECRRRPSGSGRCATPNCRQFHL